MINLDTFTNFAFPKPGFNVNISHMGLIIYVSKSQRHTNYMLDSFSGFLFL